MKRPLYTHLFLSSSVAPTEWAKDPKDSSDVLRAISAVLKAPPDSDVPVCHLFYTPGAPSDDHTILWYPQRVQITGVTTANAVRVLECIRQGDIESLPAGVGHTPILGA